MGRIDQLQAYREYKNLPDGSEEKQIWKQSNPLVGQVDRAVKLARQKMREQNRVLDHFLWRFGYVPKRRHPDNIGNAEQL